MISMYSRQRNATRILAMAAGALLAAGSLAPGAVAAQTVDARWQPWLGCWTPDGAAAVDVGNASSPLVCVSPVAGSGSVDIATIANRQVVHLEHVSTTGAHISKTVDNCPGWESATWSKDGRRLLMRSEFDCGNKTTVKGSAVFAISAEGDWLQIQGNTVGTNASARTVRYHPAGVQLANSGALADSMAVRTVPAANAGFAIRSLRAAAGGPVANTDALLDVASHVDPAVAQAWLAETHQQLRLNARQLVALADGGMSPATIDLLVAMAYPERFSIQARERRADNFDRSVSSRSRFRDDWDCGYGDRMLMYGYYGGSCYPAYYGNTQYGFGSRYGYLDSPYGYGYNYNNYYWGQSPIVIVPRDPNGRPVGGERGRAVKGEGYTRASSSDGSSSAPRTSSGSSGSGSSSSSPPAAKASGSTSGGDGGSGRTAKARPPG